MKSFVLFLALITIGCATSPISTAPSSNPNIKVEFMFEHDGCRVYRFDDQNGAQHYVYYVRCAGFPASHTSWFESCGKDCSRYQQVITEN